MASAAITFLSFIVFILSLPFSLFLCIKVIPRRHQAGPLATH
jgi:hypothetical protein